MYERRIDSESWRRSYSWDFPSGRPDVERGWRELREIPKPAGITQENFEHWIFVNACAMFAYGHIEQAFDIIRYTPRGPSRAAPNIRGGNLPILKCLLPMPKELDPADLAQHDKILAWLRENVPRLRWDEEEGHYVWTE